MTTIDPTPGLRERKKVQTRAALTWAAVRLAVERGHEGVRVEDIAAAADVSPRTFNNYFSSKAEAIAARHVDRLHGIAAALRARGGHEPLWSVLGAVVVEQFEGESAGKLPPQKWTDGIRMMLEEPAVQAELLRGSRAAEREVAAAIAERIGAGATDLYPQLAAAAMGAAIHVALERWIQSARPVAIRRLLQDSMAQLADLGVVPPGGRAARARRQR